MKLKRNTARGIAFTVECEPANAIRGRSLLEVLASMDEKKTIAPGHSVQLGWCVFFAEQATGDELQFVEPDFSTNARVVRNAMIDRSLAITAEQVGAHKRFGIDPQGCCASTRTSDCGRCPDAQRHS